MKNLRLTLFLTKNFSSPKKFTFMVTKDNINVLTARRNLFEKHIAGKNWQLFSFISKFFFISLISFRLMAQLSLNCRSHYVTQSNKLSSCFDTNDWFQARQGIAFNSLCVFLNTLNYELQSVYFFSKTFNSTWRKILSKQILFDFWYYFGLTDIFL